MPAASPLCDDKEVIDDKLPAGALEQAAVPSVDSTLGVPESTVRASRVWLKLDLLVLPIAFLLSFFVALDATSIGNARIAGLQRTLGISNEQFSIALTVSVIPCIVFQVPFGYLMMVIGPQIILPIWMTLTGVCTALQGVATTYRAFLACRFFAGFFQATLAPAVEIYLSSFYPRRMLQLRMPVAFISTMIAPSMSSLLAAGIERMDGLRHRSGYAWLFLLDGIVSVALGMICFLIIPKSPSSVYFLNASERQLVARTVADGSISTETSAHNGLWCELRSALMQPHVLLNALTAFLLAVTFSGLFYFIPSVVVGLGYEGSKAQLLSIPPFGIGAALSFLAAFTSDRYHCRGLTIAISATVAAVGFATYIASGRNSIRYMSLILAVVGTCCAFPALATWQANNMALPVRRAMALAFSSMITHFGNILSVWLFGTLSTPPRYTAATITLLAFQIVIVLCALLELVYLRARNRRKQLAQEAYLREHGERPSFGGIVPYDSIWFEYVM